MSGSACYTRGPVEVRRFEIRTLGRVARTSAWLGQDDPGDPGELVGQGVGLAGVRPGGAPASSGQLPGVGSPIGGVARARGALEPATACRDDCSRGLLNLLCSSLLEGAVTFGRSRRATQAQCRLRHPSDN